MGLTLILLSLLCFNQDASTPDPGVVFRGDHEMGFSHETTTHHFRLYSSGGAIEVTANDPSDSRSRDQIRIHLTHITKMFSAGDFNVPMLIHDKTPPGSETMSKLKVQIRYQLHDTPQGATIEIITNNKKAIDAVHEFLRFQISDHKTGDSTQVLKTPI
jgi:hypothetical protein